MQGLDWPLSQVEKTIAESKDGVVMLFFQLFEYFQPGVQPANVIPVSQLQHVTEHFREEFFAIVKTISGVGNLDK